MADEYNIYPQDLPDTPPPPGASAQQRLRIQVPDVLTTLSMGAKADRNECRLEDGGDPNYPGFGVYTEGHVFFDANGGKTKSKMSLQANGQILIQSDEDSLYMVSSGPNVLATPAVANLAGGGGVTIAAGWGTGVSNPRATAAIDGPQFPEAITSLPDHLGSVSNWYSVIDSTMAVVSAAAGLWATRLANGSLKMSDLLSAGNASAVGCIANNTLGSFGKNPAAGGVTIHGTTGWLLGTPLYGSAYAAAGLTIGSAFPAIVGLVDTSVATGRDTSIVSVRDFAVTSGRRVSVLAKKDLELAARGGKMTVRAPNILIGSAADVGEQQEVDSVKVEANDTVVTGRKTSGMRGRDVSVSAGNKMSLYSESHASMTAKYISLASSGGLALTDKANVMIGAGDGQVLVNNKGVYLGWGEAVPQPNVPTIDEFSKSRDWSNHSLNEFLNAFRKHEADAKAHYEAAMKVTPSKSQIMVSENRVQLKYKNKAQIVGDSSGWKIGKKTLVVKE